MKVTFSYAILIVFSLAFGHSFADEPKLPANTPPDTQITHRLPYSIQAFAKIGLSYL